MVHLKKEWNLQASLELHFVQGIVGCMEDAHWQAPLSVNPFHITLCFVEVAILEAQVRSLCAICMLHLYTYSWGCSKCWHTCFSGITALYIQPQSFGSILCVCILCICMYICAICTSYPKWQIFCVAIKNVGLMKWVYTWILG